MIDAHDIPAESKTKQRQKILDALAEHGDLTTDDCREYLSVMSPAARIMELRQEGYEISTIVRWSYDHNGVRRRMASYRLGGAQ